MNTIHFEGYTYIHLDNKFHQSMLFLHIVYMDHYHRYLKEVVDLVVVMVVAGAVMVDLVDLVDLVLEQEKTHNILSNNDFHHRYHNFFLRQSNYNHTVHPEEQVGLEDLEDLEDLVDLVGLVEPEDLVDLVDLEGYYY